MKTVKNIYETLYDEKERTAHKPRSGRRKNDLIHRYFLFFLDPYVNTRHEIVKRILPSGERYLDIGCWTGESTVSYGAFEKFAEVYGLDISESAAADASKKGIKVHVLDINSDPLPFPDAYFDCVTMVAVIEHLIEPHHILGEIRRVLKENGTFIIGTANVASLANRLRMTGGRRPRTSFDPGWDGGHLLYFTPRELKELLDRFGFKVVRRYATGNLPWLRRVFFNLTGEFIFQCVLGSEGAEMARQKD